MVRREAEAPSREVPLVRIFLSSPGDAVEERTFARQFIDSELPKLPPFRDKVKFELIAWDDPAARIPMLATQAPQDSVNAARPRPADCDIVIVILWSRMGTPLPDSVRKPNGKPYLSGTEWEYEDALHSSCQPRPEVYVYRRTEKPKVELGDPELADKLGQFQRVEAFFAQLRSLKRGVNEYTTPSDFKTLLSQNLQEILWRRLQPSGHNGEPPPTAATFPLEYYTWLRHSFEKVELLGAKEGRAITLNHVYVPAMTRPAPKTVTYIPGTPRVANREIFWPLLPKSENLKQPLIPLLQRLDLESLYVQAPAGAGKSTFCRWAALQSIPDAEIAHPLPASEDFIEPVPASLRSRLPLLIPLREFWRSMNCGRGERKWHRADLEKALTDWVDHSPLPGLSGDLVKAHLEVGTTFLLFDGLDEVPVLHSVEGVKTYPRALLLSGLADALSDWKEAGNRILLTSRPYGLDEVDLARLNLEGAPLEPLSEPLQDLFIKRWFHTLDKSEQSKGLIETIRGRKELAPLVENPMLLTALCVLYDSGGQLPEDRYVLYKSIVSGVLHNRYPGDASERDPVERRLEAIALGMHTGGSDSPRLTPAIEISWFETERLLADFAALNPVYERDEVEAAVRREELLKDSGLLVPRPNDRVAFYHLSFQEFLAAQRLPRTSEDIEQVFRERSRVPEWLATLLFLFVAQIAIWDAQRGLRLLGRLINDQQRAKVKANPSPAVFMAEALDLCLAKKYAVPEPLKEGFRRLALDAIKDEVNLQARQTLGLLLGRLGDPRIFGLRDLQAYVEVLPGRYFRPRDTIIESIDIRAAFRFGRYPVTNGQYQAFIDDGGYHERRWWSEGGWPWQQQTGVSEPAYWSDRRWNSPNQPVVGVSFWEAEACSKWAGGRLPREEEWEAAVGGREGFTYPWGNDWQEGICNTGEAGVTSPVGLFPRSRQAQLGIEDMAGDVWEWCSGKRYRESDAAEQANEHRVLRGGSWDPDPGRARSASRSRNLPSSRGNYFGFRVVIPISDQ